MAGGVRVLPREPPGRRPHFPRLRGACGELPRGRCSSRKDRPSAPPATASCASGSAGSRRGRRGHDRPRVAARAEGDTVPAFALFLATYKLETHRAGDLANARSGTDGDRALARSDLQPAAPALGYRHPEPRRLRGAIVGSPRSGLTQMFPRSGQVQDGENLPAADGQGQDDSAHRGNGRGRRVAQHR